MIICQALSLVQPDSVWFRPCDNLIRKYHTHCCGTVADQMVGCSATGLTRSRAETGTGARLLHGATLDTSHRLAYIDIPLIWAPIKLYHCKQLPFLLEEVGCERLCEVGLAWGNINTRSSQNFLLFETLHLFVCLSVCAILWCFHNVVSGDQIQFSGLVPAEPSHIT